MIGTHTHVQTADEGVYGGTAYMTDVGMSGVQHTAIGMQFERGPRALPDPAAAPLPAGRGRGRRV